VEAGLELTERSWWSRNICCLSVDNLERRPRRLRIANGPHMVESCGTAHCADPNRIGLTALKISRSSDRSISPEDAEIMLPISSLAPKAWCPGTCAGLQWSAALATAAGEDFAPPSGSADR